MKTGETKKIIGLAEERGLISLAEVDSILKDDSTFEKNVELLIRSLPTTILVKWEPEETKVTRRTSGRKESKAALTAYGQDSELLRGYLKEINRQPRMNREEEILYSKRLEFFKRRLVHAIQDKSISKSMQKLLLQFKDCPGTALANDLGPLCHKLGKCPRGKSGALKDCCSNYNSVRTEFVERNLRLVVNLARQYRTYGLPLMDLIQEGNAALIRAVEKYDWRKGVRFQTYANFWTKQAIERCITANKGIVRVPNYLQQKIRRYQRNGIIPSDKSNVSVREMSEAFDVPTDVAGRLLETGRGHVSLDAVTSENDESSIIDMLATEDEEAMPEGEYTKLQGRLNEAMAVLNEQERFIISHRFGLDGKEIQTLDEIGKRMSVSRERIRQLQIRALQKLKRPSLMKRLAPFLS